MECRFSAAGAGGMVTNAVQCGIGVLSDVFVGCSQVNVLTPQRPPQTRNPNNEFMVVLLFDHAKLL